MPSLMPPSTSRRVARLAVFNLRPHRVMCQKSGGVTLAQTVQASKQDILETLMERSAMFSSERRKVGDYIKAQSLAPP